MKKSGHRSQWVLLTCGPILALVAFVLGYYLDPLSLGEHTSLSAMPAFLLSVVILIITHIIATHNEVEKVSFDSSEVYEAVKSYLHVTKIGTPKKAWEYIMSRLPVLDYVQNTSFNFEDEGTETTERLYADESYQRSAAEIAHYVEQGLTWRDIGDESAEERFKKISTCASSKRNHSGHYEYRLISQAEPQIGFVLLTYKDGTIEVLFNWDFRDIPHDPTVLLSRDSEILNMFAAQFKGLWRASVQSYDNNATRSTS